MKKILLIIVTIAMVYGFTSCRNTYNTYSAGKENSSFVLVLKKDVNVNDVRVVIDGQTFDINKVYTVKKARKARPIEISSGKHNLKLIVNDRVIREETIFLGLQETKKIVITKQDLNNPAQ